MNIKAYLLNQRALVVSEIAQRSKDGKMNFYDLNLLTGRYTVIEDLLRELIISQDATKAKKKN